MTTNFLSKKREKHVLLKNHLSGREKAVPAVQHDNVAFGFATYLHVKGFACAKQDVVALLVEKKKRKREREREREREKRKEKKQKRRFSRVFKVFPIV